MKRHWSGQQGAILVLTAFLLPFIIAFTGMAVDFGSAYVRRSQLQNAADAAVLAGAYQVDNKNKTKATIEEYLSKNLGELYTTYALQDNDDFPKNQSTLNYNYIISDAKDTLELSAKSSVNTTFLRLFNINNISVSVYAKAKISSTSTNINDDMFNFGLVAAHFSKANYDPRIQKNSDYSILFDTEPVFVDGNIMTNGKIVSDNDQQNILTGKVYASSDVKKQGETFSIKDYWQDGLKRTKIFEPDVWGYIGSYNPPSTWDVIRQIFRRFIKNLLGIESTDDWYAINKYFTFANINGNAFTYEKEIDPPNPPWPYQYGGKWQDISNPNKVIYRESIDISLANNPGINSLIEKYKNMSSTELEKNHIYLDLTSGRFHEFTSRQDSNVEYPGLTMSSPPNKSYRVVIVDGDLKVNLKYPKAPKDTEYAILISLNGNIEFHNDSVFNGIVYAPNINNNQGKGHITIDGGKDIHGSIVGQTILLNKAQQKIYWKNYFQTGNQSIPGTNEKRVYLIK